MTLLECEGYVQRIDVESELQKPLPFLLVAIYSTSFILYLYIMEQGTFILPSTSAQAKFQSLPSFLVDCLGVIFYRIHDLTFLS